MSKPKLVAVARDCSTPEVVCCWCNEARARQLAHMEVDQTQFVMCGGCLSDRLERLQKTRPIASLVR